MVPLHHPEFRIFAPQNNTQLGFFFFRKEDAESLIEKVRKRASAGSKSSRRGRGEAVGMLPSQRCQATRVDLLINFMGCWCGRVCCCGSKWASAGSSSGGLGRREGEGRGGAAGVWGSEAAGNARVPMAVSFTSSLGR